MRTIMWCLLVITASVAEAAVYKWVDEHGNVHFSDTPRQGAEEVRVPPAQTYSAPKLPATPPSVPRDAAKAPDYQRFELIAPENEATIRDNLGALTVSFALDPGLKPGHQIQLLLDGQVQTTGQKVTVNVQNVHRGSHSLQGQVIDTRGKVVMSTQTITVHMHRQSALAPNRLPPPKPKAP